MACCYIQKQHILSVPGKVIKLRKGESTGKSVTILWEPPHKSEDYKTLEYLIRNGIEGSELRTRSRRPYTKTNVTLSNLGTYKYTWNDKGCWLHTLRIYSNSRMSLSNTIFQQLNVSTRRSSSAINEEKESSRLNRKGCDNMGMQLDPIRNDIIH